MRPDRIWTGDWRTQSAEARRAANGRPVTPTYEPEAPPEPSPGPSPERPRRSLLDQVPKRFLAGVAGAALVLAAVLGGIAIGQGGEAGQGTRDTSRPLPAASDQPVRPQRGQTQARAVYASASPAVVSIRAGNSTGTGFLIDSDGRIVTNSHVVDGNDRVEVRFGADGDSIAGAVRGSDASSDLAVVQIDAGAIPAGVKPLRLADSNNVQVGDMAIAIGNPFGLDRTATEGIVSGIGREIQAPNGFSIDSVIQTDAPINPGNSGGPLLDASGHVIGVNSQIETGGSQGNVGIGFAVPSNTVRQVVPALMRGQEIKRAYLGVQTTPPSNGAQDGAQVASVVANGPAARAGIRTGDVITRIDGQAVKEPSDVAAALSDDRPGKVVTAQVQRDGSAVTVSVTLGTRPASPPSTP